MIEPLRLSLDLRCPPEHAFEVWARKISAWWPADHTVAGVDGVEVVLEPRVGGRIYERGPDGTESEWGEVTLWEPPGRLGYLWHLRRDRADATDVLISFNSQPDGTTRMEIEHTGWERLGAGGQEWRDRNLGGWTTLFPSYLEAIGE